MDRFRWEAIGFLAEKIELARGNFLGQTGADGLQLLIGGLAAQFFLGDGQVAAERLNIQVGQLHGNFEVIAGRSQAAE